jgi:1,4-alpha-glucan branching enzyme
MSVQPTPDGDGSVVATFRLPAQVQATTVHVVGDFNDWSTSAHPMESDGDGFVAHVPLESGRQYRFRYLIDGARWENDWAADDYVDNAFGGTDSVLDLTQAPAADPAPPTSKRRTKRKVGRSEPDETIKEKEEPAHG